MAKCFVVIIILDEVNCDLRWSISAREGCCRGFVSYQSPDQTFLFAWYLRRLLEPAGQTGWCTSRSCNLKKMAVTTHKVMEVLVKTSIASTALKVNIKLEKDTRGRAISQLPSSLSIRQYTSNTPPPPPVHTIPKAASAGPWNHTYRPSWQAMKEAVAHWDKDCVDRLQDCLETRL